MSGRVQLRVGTDGPEGTVDGAVEVWRAALAADGVRPPAARVARVRDKVAAPDALLVVTVVRERVVGMALGEWGRAGGGTGALEPGLLHLALLAVLPAARRRGIGTTLVEGLADAAYVRGARRLSLWTPSSRDFLLACGLEPTGSTREAGAPLLAQWTAELEPPTRELEVAAGLRLGQLLKLAGLADTGSEAKQLLATGGVTVNDELELRRGRQLAHGDVVVAHDRAVRVLLADGPAS